MVTFASISRSPFRIVLCFFFWNIQVMYVDQRAAIIITRITTKLQYIYISSHFSTTIQLLFNPCTSWIHLFHLFFSEKNLSDTFSIAFFFSIGQSTGSSRLTPNNRSLERDAGPSKGKIHTTWAICCHRCENMSHM